MTPAAPAWVLAARDAARAALQRVASDGAVQSLASSAGASITPGVLGAAGAVGFAVSLAGVQIFGDPRAAAGFVHAQIVITSAEHATAGTPAPHADHAPDLHHRAPDSADTHPHRHSDARERHEPVGVHGSDAPYDTEHGRPGHDDRHAQSGHARERDSTHATADTGAHPDPAPPAPRPNPLAPPPGLTQPGPGGRLPAIAPDGHVAADVYARPFPMEDARPRIALMATGLGLSPTITAQAIETLPPEVTLAFSPYAADLQQWIDAARTAGHEVVLALPMEPFDYPDDDPGPHVLLADSSAAELTRRLDWLMARATGYVAVTNHFGARFTTDGDATTRVLRTLAARGVAFVYADPAARPRLGGLAAATRARFAGADILLDARRAGRGLDEQFLRLEAGALRQGDALGAFEARGGLITAAARWAAGLEAKGYALAPVSFVVRERSTMRGGYARREPSAVGAPPRFRVVKAGFGGRDEDGYAGGDDTDAGKQAHGDGH